MDQQRAALVTGGLSGLGRAMAIGLAQSGFKVTAVGHIAQDIAETEKAAMVAGIQPKLAMEVADLRQEAECDRIIETSLKRHGTIDILVNNAGLTFTYIVPDRSTRTEQPHFWQIPDEVVRNVMETNFMIADRLARHLAPLMVDRGWGRIINVTTKLDTMNRKGSAPYGPSKAALEMASEIWAKDAEGTGLTVNILNPGAMADTPGLAQEIRDASRSGHGPKLVKPEDMVPPLLWLVSPEANTINGRRFDASSWDIELSPAQAAQATGRNAGFLLHPIGP